MGKEQKGNKNKQTSASTAKADKAAAKKAAKLKAQEELWDDEPAEAGGEEQEPSEEQSDDECDPFEAVLEFAGSDARAFEASLFGACKTQDARARIANSSEKSGDSLLHAAVSVDAAVIIPVLLKAGADANHRNKQGKTALACALERGAAEAAEPLLGAPGLDPNAFDKTGASLLHRAAFARMCEATKRLLAQGADAKKCDRQKNTPLHALAAGCQEAGAAAAAPAIQLAGMLLQGGGGSTADAPNFDGSTALHLAAGAEEAAVGEALCEVLLEHGCDASVLSRNGCSCADVAEAAGHDALAKKLVAGGAVITGKAAAGGASADAGARGRAQSAEAAAELALRAEDAMRKANAGKAAGRKKKGAAANPLQEGMWMALYALGVLAVLVLISILISPTAAPADGDVEGAPGNAAEL